MAAPPDKTRSAAATAPRLGFGQAICAHTEFECDCDCQCPRHGEVPTTACFWPDCGCGCDAACIGCRKAQEVAS